MKIDKCIIVGVGGTGSHLLLPLVKLLHFHKNGTKDITIVDGDKFEEKNETRQLFDPAYVGMNKAIALSKQNPWLNLDVVPSYISEEGMKRRLCELDEDANVLVVTAVDNLKTRQEILNALEIMDNFIYLSPGNNLSDGSAAVYIRAGGEELNPHPFVRYSDLKDADDFKPQDLGCGEKAASQPQLITANAMAATLSLVFVQNILDGNKIPFEIAFDIVKSKTKAIGSGIEIK